MSWCQIGIAKSEALSMIENQPNGTFVVRSSDTRPDWFGIRLAPVNV
jgi:hypothetical protein